MRKTVSMMALLLAFGFANVAVAGSQNPCNPCSMKSQNPCDVKSGKMNPCNPCSMKMDKKMNPCNPCSMKPQNPCDMKSGKMNPCSMQQGKQGQQWGTPGNREIREHAFDNFRQAADLGRKMWSDENLGTAGLSCLSCHGGYENLNLGKRQNFPHFVGMVGDVVTLDQMINYCMINPMQGEQFEPNSRELTAMAAYYRAYRMQYLRESRNK